MTFNKDRLRKQLRVIIFGTHTPAGRAFDIWLIVLILLSVALVFLDSVREIHDTYHTVLRLAEWTITGIFTLEYLIRLWISDNWRRYAFGFYGAVDLLAVVPTWLSLFFPGAEVLGVVRALRLTRVFRILNMFEYVREARMLLIALLASRHRILVFMLAVLAMVTVFGTVMFMVESPEAGFTSIPRSIYWAIVTLTTVGYGDIAPVTNLGQAIASMIMLLGYAIIAIPTGIVSVEMARQMYQSGKHACLTCGELDHPRMARHCHQCGKALPLISRDDEGSA